MASHARAAPAAKGRSGAFRRTGGGAAPAAVAAMRKQFARTHDQLLLYARDLNHLLRSERNKRRELAAANQQLIKYARDLKKIYEAEKKRAREVQAAHVEAIRHLTAAAEYKDEETAQHIQRISHYSKVLAEEMEMPEKEAELLFDAAPMHDVGKIGVPDTVLLKQAPLAPDEWEVMKTHALMGEDILSGSRSPLLRMAAEIAGCHHERWDGGGYPRGLRGEAIPLPARIVMLADVYDALRSRRPYKPAFTHEKACVIILNGDGRTQPTHFDPRLLEIFVRAKGRFGEIFEKLSD
ncbi:MAG: HD-GYP domain-containing protein [Gammaproteobacteria bacterium]